MCYKKNPSNQPAAAHNAPSHIQQVGKKQETKKVNTQLSKLKTYFWKGLQTRNSILKIQFLNNTVEILYTDNTSTMVCLLTKENGLYTLTPLRVRADIFTGFVQCGLHLTTQTKRKLIIFIYIYGPTNQVKFFSLVRVVKNKKKREIISLQYHRQHRIPPRCRTGTVCSHSLSLPIFKEHKQSL